MKKTVTLVLLLSSLLPINAKDSAERPTSSPRKQKQQEKKQDSQIFDFDVSLCDDELLHHNIEMPEESMLRQWMTKIGCAFLAKYYVAQELVQDGYDKTKRILVRLKNYYFPAQNNITTKRSDSR